jgi:menaquinone-dependent protoporphyrinogen oxidase
VTNVLVAYASKRGSTAEIADAIAVILRQAGLSVDCIEAGKVSSVESSDAVVLGSAVYIKRWRGDAKHFLRKHDQELSPRPLWVSARDRSETRKARPTRPGWSRQR